MGYCPNIGKKQCWGGLLTFVNGLIIFTFNIYIVFLLALYANKKEDLFIYISA